MPTALPRILPPSALQQLSDLQLVMPQRASCGASSHDADKRARDTASPDVSRSPASAARWCPELLLLVLNTPLLIDLTN